MHFGEPARPGSGIISLTFLLLNSKGRRAVIPFRVCCLVLVFSFITPRCPCQTGAGTASNKAGRAMYFDHLTRDNGLPSNTVQCAIQDLQGYIWIGTSNGLVRYDGHDMQIFRHIPGDSSTLPDNTINTLFQGRDSLIWIGTGNGIGRFDPATREFQNFIFEEKEKQEGILSRNRIHAFFEGPGGTVWIGSGHGLICATKAGSRFTQYLLSSTRALNSREYFFNKVFCIAVDPVHRNALLLGTGGGVVSFDTVGKTILKDYRSPPGKNFAVHQMMPDAGNKVWASGFGFGINRLDLNKGTWEFPYLVMRDFTVLSFIPKSADEFWLFTDEHGLMAFNKCSHEATPYRHLPSDSRSISSDVVMGGAYFNGRKDFWIWGMEGIDIENPDYFSFDHYRVPYKFWWISDFCKDEATGKLFVGAYRCKGLPVLDTRRNQWQLVKCRFPVPDEGFSVNRLYRDSKGRLWVSSRNNLSWYDPAENCLREFTLPGGKPLDIKQNSVFYGIHEDDEGNLWVGTQFEGVVRISADRTRADYFRHDPANPGSLMEGSRFHSFVTDNRHRLWIGCSYGLCIYDPVKNIFLNGVMDTLRKNGIRKTWVNGIEKDSLGRIWITIDQEGLVRAEIRPGGSFSIKLFHNGNGMNDPSTGPVNRDIDGNLWVMNRGLLRVNPYREEFMLIDNRNGLFENPGGSQMSYCEADGTLYVGDSVGFASRNIRSIRDPEQNRFTLVIESLEINGKVSRQKFSGAGPVVLDLPAGQNNLVFRFTAICFRDVNRIRYRYRMEGYDRDWISSETSREARYTNLPAGRYQFVVAASAGAGWNSCRQSFRIRIHPYLWQTWWFILGSALTGMLLVYLVYRYRVNHLLNVERLRTRIATDLHDDVSSTLSSISILSDILASRVAEPRSAEMISDIGSNSRSMLERIDDIIWTVNPRNDKFEDLGLRIREFAIPLFESGNIAFTFEYPEDPAAIPLSMTVRRSIYLIAKEAINNLVKYSGCTHAAIRFRLAHPLLIMEVSDNGKGFDPGMETSRNGLRNMHERARRIKATLTIKSAPGTGTVVTLAVKKNG